MFFPITTAILAGCIFWARAKGGRCGALFLSLCVWGLGVVLMSVPIFTYDVAYSVAVDAFVAACLFVTTLCYLLARAKPRDVATTYWNRPREMLLAKVLGVAGIIGCIPLLIGAEENLSVSYLLENLASIREANFDSLEDPVAGTATAFLAGILASGSVLSVIAAARFGRPGGRLLIALGIVNFILISTVGLFVYGGRSTLFYVIGLMLISFYVSGRHSGRRIRALSPKNVLLAIVLAVSAGYFSTSWVQTREGSVDPEEVLVGTQRANYRPWIKPLARSDDALGIGLVNIGYMASPLPTLAFYVQQGPLPGPFWGSYSYPLPALALGRLTMTPPSQRWSDTRHKVFAPIEAAGYFGNVWSTWLRDLLIDFGYLGAIIFCGAFGAFMAWARNGYERTGALHYHCFEVLACFVFAYGAFTGILFVTFLVTAFFMTLALMFAARATFSGEALPFPWTQGTQGQPAPSRALTRF